MSIYAHWYGHIPSGSEVSITELEFKHAKDKDKPIFCFLVDEDHSWLPSMIETEPGRTKLSRFKDTLQMQLVRETFKTPNDLAAKVAASVGRYIAEASVPVPALVTGVQYTGDRLSLNFEEIEIRIAIAILAEFIGQNIIAGDDVTGTITLKLDDVPWDEALDFIMMTKGLEKFESGTITLIAPIGKIMDYKEHQFISRSG